MINITGLACGITCTLLAVLYWKDERSFDTFHKNNPNLYRVTTNLRNDKEGNRVTVGKTGQVQGPAFKAAVPEVQNYVRILGGDIYTNLVADNKVLHLRSFFVDSTFFKVFSFRIVKGDIIAPLKEINSVVLTETTARKFFNSTDVVGRVFSMDADPSYNILARPLMVSAVVEDPPGNSSLQFDALFTLEFMQLSFDDTNWLNQYLGTFVLLHPNASIQKVKEKFNAVYDAHGKKQVGKPEYDFMNGYDPDIKYGLQPIQDIHLNAGIITDGFNEAAVGNVSSPVYSYVFMGIALFILVMAAINFINISIAGSLKRAKEVGVRKISGGNRGQIITQFLLESSLLCLAAFLLSIVLMNLALPFFNQVTGKQLSFQNVIDWQLTMYFIVVLFFIILLTGFYPAFVLSNFKAPEVLYNKQKLNGRNLLGRSLVVLQFSLAVFLLVAATVYYLQMDFIRTKDLGYNPYNIIRTAVNGDIDYRPVLNTLRNELAKEPSVKAVSFGNDGRLERVEVNSRSFESLIKGIDENYLSVMEIPLSAGRSLSVAFGDDTLGNILVNQAFVKAAGLQEPIGQTVLYDRYYADSTRRKIAGVIKDYHWGSLREPIKPMVMYWPETADGMSGVWVKIDKSKQRRAMEAIEKIYKTTMPRAFYEYDFIDELNTREYLQEQRWQKLVNFAAVLALVLCSLGLFGLAHLAANRRIKEIGVRKVLGASLSQVTSLLTVDFLKLVFVSFAVAFPAAWFVMNRWLRDYAYRIEINWWIFLIAALLALLVATCTVGVQAIKAAIANPVKSLRTE
ncbi:MAG: FtsX-like permease family protein [Ferruginibacter sp.]